MAAGWTAPRRAVAAWAAYVWADHAFATIVATFVVATYFTQGVAANPVTGAAQWAAAQAVAGVLIAVLAVPMGAIADQGGRRGAMLATCLVAMAASTLALWFVRPDPAFVPLALVLVGIGTIAFELAAVFYNAMLPDLAPRARFGLLSNLGWAAGYAGGLASLVLALVLLVLPDPALFGLDRGQAEHIRACAVLAGAWSLAFGWPAVVFIPERAAPQPWGPAIRAALAELRTTLRTAIAEPPLRRLLVARMLFMDGLVTLFAFGGIYAAGEFGFSAQDVLVFGIGLNVTAGLGVLGFAFIEDRIGAKATVLTSLVALVVLGLPLLLVREPAWFWSLGLALGLFVGPAQAASRSLMAHMAPDGSRAAWFGLFALSGRVTAFLGPAALALATAVFQSQRAGMAVILVFIAAGAVVLAPLRLPAAQR
ncbi:MAG: MFS transporter [Acetobacteraceae bacterium]|nr:MFS transporter [Acetobacteraceae bacterium]